MNKHLSGMDNCKLEDYISQLIGQKMVTPQECLQMKRDLEAKNDSDFEASPLALCMMITLLLFGICLWIWLISWSCFFGQSSQNDEKNIRLSGGISNRSQKKEGRLKKRSNKDKSYHSFRSQILRKFNPLADIDLIPHASLHRLGGRNASPTGNSETEVSGPQKAYGATASNLAKDRHKASRKYKIQWSKLFKLRRIGDRNN